jgi:hypothetical protein
MYSSKCRECGVLANTSHLREQHGSRLDIMDIMVRLQDSKRERSARNDINRGIRTVDGLTRREERME